jgi:hypothetical protein
MSRLWWLRSGGTTAANAYVGGYGWLEEVRPGARTTAAEGGYVLAPSPAHAGAAAVLRSGYLSHRSGSDTSAFAVDLSGACASCPLDGVRQGQPLGAVLGCHWGAALMRGRRLDRQYRRAAPLAGRGCRLGRRRALPPSGPLTVWRSGAGGRQPSFAAGLSSGCGKPPQQLCAGRAVGAASGLLAAESVYQTVRNRCGGSQPGRARRGSHPAEFGDPTPRPEPPSHRILALRLASDRPGGRTVRFGRWPGRS